MAISIWHNVSMKLYVSHVHDIVYVQVNAINWAPLKDNRILCGGEFLKIKRYIMATYRLEKKGVVAREKNKMKTQIMQKLAASRKKEVLQQRVSTRMIGKKHNCAEWQKMSNCTALRVYLQRKQSCIITTIVRPRKNHSYGKARVPVESASFVFVCIA